MADIKLVGRDDIATSGANDANRLIMSKFTANESGAVITFKMRATGTGNVKVGIYSDSAGEPDVLLNSVASTAVGAGVNSITITATGVTSGTDYWLAYNSDAAVVGYKTETGVRRYKDVAFATALPNPAGSGYSTSTTANDILAGWGPIQVLSPASIFMNTIQHFKNN